MWMKREKSSKKFTKWHFVIDIERMAAYHYDWSEVFSMNSPKEPEPGPGPVGEGHRSAGRILRMTSGGPQGNCVTCRGGKGSACVEGFIGG
jgi:hypothetical protein